MTRPPRPSAKAVIAEETRLLLIHLRHPRAGDFYQLPGGGLRPGEGPGDALTRETREETGYTVKAHELLWVRDYVASHHDYGYIDPPGFHAVELMFRASLAGAAAADPHEADEFQVGVEWVEVRRLPEVNIFPRALVAPLQAYLTDRTVMRPVYLGDAA